MMQWTITYYNEDVRELAIELPDGLKGRYLKLIERMEHMGSHLGMPHTEALGDGLFELRVKAEEGIARAFYCTQVGKVIVILHVFIKKTQAVPKKELALARERLKQVRNYAKKRESLVPKR